MSPNPTWAEDLCGYRYLFFTGKGGVGKTSLACATALHLAQRGRKTLLVSTDPASNLDEVLGVSLGADPQAIDGRENLFAANLDPEEAALQSIEEQFSGACTVEIAAFNEFTRLLGGSASVAAFETIVFDTAPTGHTLRLLSLPAAWSGFIDGNTTGVSCIGPLAQLQDQAALYRASLAALRDAERTAVVLVARPDRPSLKEAARASTEFAYLGVSNLRLIVNGVLSPAPSDAPDAIAEALFARSQAAMDEMPHALCALPRTIVPLLPAAMVGLQAIGRLLDPTGSGKPFDPANTTDDPYTTDDLPADVAADSRADTLNSLESLLEEMVVRGRGVLMTMGKGGVGKTTLASEIAIWLASRGRDVLLTTTDPAAHVADTIAGTIAGRAHGLSGRLEVTRIDPEAEVAAYRSEVMASAGADLEDAGRALLEEDLRSPCTEEIAVFRAFARVVEAGTDRMVVLDTAPTGHTLLLLDAAEAYHREVLRKQAQMPPRVRELLPRLRDPEYTRIFVVTLPEPTPVHEAERLQTDLERAGIMPFAWVVNQSFAATDTRHPLLRTRARQEAAMVAQVRRLARRMVVLPWRAEPLSAQESPGDPGLQEVLATAF